MTFHIFSLQPDSTSFFKQIFTFIRTIYHLKRTIYAYMSFYISPFYYIPTIILTGLLELGTFILHMIIHVVQREHQSTIKQTFNYSVWTKFCFVDINLFSYYFATYFIIRTSYRSVETNFEMLINLSFSYYIFTLIVKA